MQSFLLFSLYLAAVIHFSSFPSTFPLSPPALALHLPYRTRHGTARHATWLQPQRHQIVDQYASTSNLILSHLSPLIYYTTLYYTTLYHTTLYYAIPYYATLYYTTLYYTVLYYTTLYYTILIAVSSVYAITSLKAHSTVQHSTAQYSTAPHTPLLHPSLSSHRLALPCPALQVAALHSLFNPRMRPKNSRQAPMAPPLIVDIGTMQFMALQYSALH